MAVDLKKARARMVIEQLERRGIKNARVLRAMRSIPRERFIPPELADHAYDDGPLPIGGEQTISQPYMVALMTEVAAPSDTEQVLEVGTGSGYQTAVLSRLSAHVFSIECDQRLHDRAAATLAAMSINNCTLLAGDGSLGWPQAAPFDLIMVTAAMPGIPRPLLEQLRADARLVAPVGEGELQALVRISRAGGHWQEQYFGECRFVKMSGQHGFSN
ncbi:MAG: protein-L-isoaspartate(D-aspartate) O-methyltransferase [Candidatus Binataceae bacterium]|nr:protein-L-isoaspartate(D-aspartate) O-methyltransferase [Candidatus Binataceae bacterium]